MDKFYGFTSGVLKQISTIVVSLKKGNFLPERTKKFERAVAFMCHYLELDEIQTVLFCSFFTAFYDYSERPVSLYSLSDFYECNPLCLVQYKNSIDILVDKNYIEECETPDGMYGQAFYKIPDYVTDAIVSNTKIVKMLDENTRSIQHFIRRLERIVDRRIENDESIESMFKRIKHLENEYKHREEIKRIIEILPDISDRELLYDTAAGMFNHLSTDVEFMILVNRGSDATNRQNIAQSLSEENHNLFKLDFIQFEKKGSMMESTVSLTDKALESLFGDEGKLYQKKIGDKSLKEPDKIQKKELFYMPENQADIDRLFTAMQKENLKSVQKRLEERSMPTGICIMFYGAPGTGKTETVYQIAKSTGRQVFHVDFGNLRSMWYGETEQKVKKVFTDYKKMCENAKKSDGLFPILLFNEADAIFGKRREVSGPGEGGKTDNTIQNILLDEMESLQGILIATTNFADNLDSAFERRFLFKIKFAKPDRNVKQKIWKSKIPWISDDDAMYLAKNFPFSGGEIDNVVRKITMDEVLTGKTMALAEIESYCKTEKLHNESNVVGFMK